MPQPIRHVWAVTGIIAVGLFGAGFIAHANRAGPGSVGNIGALMLAYLFWLLSFAAAVTSAVTFIVARRSRHRVSRGFPVVDRRPGDGSAAG